MKNSDVRYPILASVVLQSLSVLIGVVIYFLQDSLGILYHINIEGRVFPDCLISMVITLVMYSVIYSLILNYKGASNRTIGIIMTVFICVFQIFSTFFARILVYFAARKGAEFLAAKNVLDSTIGLITSPFCFIALVLAIVSIARFGIKEKHR